MSLILFSLGYGSPLIGVKLSPQNKEDLENVDENPVFQLYAEARENDWKSMLSLSLSQIPVKALNLN